MRPWSFPDDVRAGLHWRLRWRALTEPDERVVAAIAVTCMLTALAAWLQYEPVLRPVRAPAPVTVLSVAALPAPVPPPPVPLPAIPQRAVPVFAPPVLTVPQSPQPTASRSSARLAAVATRPAAPAQPAVTLSPPPVPLSKPVHDAPAEARYVATLRAIIAAHKRNPQNAGYRLMHPHGTAIVVFAVSRNGTAGSARVASSSGSEMLDAQAVLIVGACRFPPMPAAIFPGESQHEFQVEITFPPFQSTE